MTNFDLNCKNLGVYAVISIKCADSYRKQIKSNLNTRWSAYCANRKSFKHSLYQ